MSESRHRMSMITGGFDASAVGFERVEPATAMTARAGYQHYDAIIADMNSARDDVLASVEEIRRLESSRGQPSTPILGVSSSDDALADLDAISRGCTEVHRGAADDPALGRMVSQLIKGTMQAA